MSNGGNWDGTTWKVGLSDTEVFPVGTMLSVSKVKGQYQVEVTEAGDCPPTTNPLQAEVVDKQLVTEEFTVECDPSGTLYVSTATRIGSAHIGGSVEPSSASAKAAPMGNGDPAGTYTAEEEGGGAVEG